MMVVIIEGKHREDAFKKICIQLGMLIVPVISYKAYIVSLCSGFWHIKRKDNLQYEIIPQMFKLVSMIFKE